MFTVSLSAQRPLGMGEGAFAQSLALGGEHRAPPQPAETESFTVLNIMWINALDKYHHNCYQEMPNFTVIM